MFAAAGALGVALPRVARADCSGDPFGLLWSYPTNGAIDVPLDADLFVNGQLMGPPSLDGEPLPRIAPGIYDLGQLEPLTRYEVSWDGAVIQFTTGESVSFALREPASDVRVTRNPVDFARCPLVLPQGCFDTGQHTGVRFDAGGSIAWLVDVVSCGGGVRQMVWPGACGVPLVESEDRIVCASLRSTNGAALSEPTGVICSVPDVPPGTLPTNSGCQGSWPPEGALTLAADDGVTLSSLSGAEIPADASQGDPAPEPAPAPMPAAMPAPAAGCALSPSASGRGHAGIAAVAGIGLAALIVLLRRRSFLREASHSPAALLRRGH